MLGVSQTLVEHQLPTKTSIQLVQALSRFSLKIVSKVKEEI